MQELIGEYGRQKPFERPCTCKGKESTEMTFFSVLPKILYLPIIISADNKRKSFYNLVINQELSVMTEAGREKFRLYAIIVHSGSVMSSGHYYALIKNQGYWYKLNDNAIVTRT